VGRPDVVRHRGNHIDELAKDNLAQGNQRLARGPKAQWGGIGGESTICWWKNGVCGCKSLEKYNIQRCILVFFILFRKYERKKAL